MKSLKEITGRLLALLSSPTVSTLVISSVVLPSLVVSLLLLSSLLATPAFATPPDRPIAAMPESIEKITSLKATQGSFTVPIRVTVNDVRINEVVINISDATTLPAKKMGEATRTKIANDKQRVKDTVVKAIVPAFSQAGIYKIELEIGDTKGVIYDRVIFYQEVSEKKQARLFTQKQWREIRQKKRSEDFTKMKSVRAFSGNLTNVDDTTLARIVTDKNRAVLLARADKELGQDAKHVIDSSKTAWRERDPVTVNGRIVFTDFDGSVKPLVNAGIYLYDDDTFGDEFLESVATNGNGDYSISVNNDDGWLQNGRDLYIKLKLRNTRWRVHDGGDYEWASGVRDDLNEGAVVNFGTLTPSDDMEAAQIFSFMDRAWQHITSVGGRDPGFVEIDYPSSGDFYNGQINLSASTNRAPDIAIHEYGHFLMDAAYPGGDPSPGGAHNFGDAVQDERLSWSEGWASAFMLSLCNDGQYNWDEGTTEGAGEWPSCTNQNDAGGQALELYSGANRLGEKQEARVAAALLDLMDSNNDNNGGSEDRGRNSLSDDNTPNRVSLETIYNQTMWDSGHNNMLQYWTSLSGELSGATWTDANEILRYNWMSISAPIDISCVASKVAAAEFKDYPAVITDLRNFRDQALKPLAKGRQLMQIYYRHSPELATLLIGDKNGRSHAAQVVRHFSSLGAAAKNHAQLEKIATNNEPLISPTIDKSISYLFQLIETKGSRELQSDLKVVRAEYRTIAKMNFADALVYAESLPQAETQKELPPINQQDLAPASRKVDWELIKRNLSPQSGINTTEKAAY
ncbi:hypothetical protein [Cellvibrio sp. UBA7671]|uniref:hypothetical protein n=1 Tax=Cellvibrio sp. UBA7671 TaxID=1946312 RepID=UPI002F35F1CD